MACRDRSYAGDVLGRESELPNTNLRGYGRVSGVFWRDSRGGSILEITCENADKARLTQSKYLSDLGVLPGVEENSITLNGVTVSTWKVEGQGWIAALQSESRVLLAAAPDHEAFERLLSRLPGVRLEDTASSAQVKVPMWLDRWDKFGFRFYYRPWEVPKGESLETYDFAKEFEFASRQERSGLVFWSYLNPFDTAGGLQNETWWDWAEAEAESQELPVGLNATLAMSGGPGQGWIYNRYRDQTSQRMPQFTGGFHRIADPFLGGNGTISWSASTAKDATLSLLQDVIGRMAARSNVTSILEPHGELRHGPHDLLLEYGPVADAGFRQYLQKKYSSLDDLDRAWGMNFPAWEEVRVPELASFLGWGPQALDLRGTWRIGYEPLTLEGEKLRPRQGYQQRVIPSRGAPAEWFSEKFDDSEWPTVVAPGHDRTMFLPVRPAVYRRSFDLPKGWLARQPQVWLYIWDMNLSSGAEVKVALNGKVIGQSTIQHFSPHWGALEVSGYLRSGLNQLTLRLPQGGMAYRIYLSPDEPRQYPGLGREKNARWVDFIDWIGWSRVEAARQGMEMIRQVAPNQQITLMAPDAYADGIKQLARAYGGNFHNTGYMSMFWADYLPSIMRGAQLPFSLEPPAPAKDLATFKKQIGLYSTEGVQGIDYFIHIGSILWNSDLRNYFEKNLQIIKLIGKTHSPRAEVAALYSNRSIDRTGYPWGLDPNTDLGSGYWKWNIRAFLRSRYESDGLTDSSFADGDAARYRVIIDTNTSIMEEKSLEDIEAYVRAGGTFVTFAQTGRHTPLEPNSWPISRLTGYRVSEIDPIDAEGNPQHTRTMRPAPGQDILTGDWNVVPANGLSLEPSTDKVQNLLLWEDGSVAVGMRQLGKGHIIQIGCKFTGSALPDRLEPRRSPQRPAHDSPSDASVEMTRLLTQILGWLKIAPIPADWEPDNENVILSHFLSNNGLYDMWSIWNQSADQPIQGAINLKNARQVPWAIDVQKEHRIALEGNRLPADLEPLQTRVFLTPCNDITKAPLSWFELQRDWWQASRSVSDSVLSPPSQPDTVDLGKDWAFRPLRVDDDPIALAQPDVDTSDWENIRLGIWSFPNRKKIKRGMLRKTFTVPAEWTEGKPSLWLQSWIEPTFLDRARVWLDGKLIAPWRSSGLADINPEGVLRPGSKHTLAVEIDGNGSLVGSRGTAWLWLWPHPISSLDLAGKWAPSSDALHYGESLQLPGPFSAMTLRREVEIPQEMAGNRAVLSVDSTGSLVGVLINGQWVRRFHHLIGTRFDLDITPWIRFGAANEIELVSMNGPTKGTVRWVRLDFHQPEK